MHTRFFYSLTLYLILVSWLTWGQTATPIKIYFFSSPSSTLRTALNVEKPIKINKLTLLETDLDSIGLNLFSDMTVYIRFERGRTYYFRNTGGGIYNNSTLNSCSEQEFWLNTYFVGPGTYRHYFLNKREGLRLLEEKTN